MDLKKTDIFGGIGVFAIQVLFTFINYLREQSNTLLVFGCLFAIITTVLIIYILRLKHANKNLLEENKKNEKELQEVEQEYSVLEEENYKTELEITEYLNSNLFFEDLSCTKHKILYELKCKQVVTEGTISELLSSVQKIFDADIDDRASVINVSLFVEENEKYLISYSLRHAKGMTTRLDLGKDSFVGHCFVEKRPFSCENLDDRKASVPFIETKPTGRKYLAILAIPGIVDDLCYCSLVITSNIAYDLESTYRKYKVVIDEHIDLLSMTLLYNEIVQEG